MLTSRQLATLCTITTRDEAGRHFREVYDAEDIDALEAAGMIAIHRPTHEATGLQYSQEYHSVEVTPEGEAAAEAFEAAPPTRASRRSWPQGEGSGRGMR